MRLPILLLLAAAIPSPAGEDYQLTLRRQQENAPGSFQVKETAETWNPKETAVIICDVWDSHHSKNAADRTAELAPRMNSLAELCRQRGSLIIHAPSDCMKSYESHPARKRAQEAPAASNLPTGIEKWLYWKDEREEKVGYPIDATDGGEDDAPADLAVWHEKLRGMGRNPKLPWLKEIATIAIDPEKDAISDKGVEVWNLLERRGIKNVLLFGVHTNMCVLGRPFGLRQLSRNGRNVVLVRDLTDTMYNPARRPQVSHFQGTELIISHVERYVCPTVSSAQLLGGAPFHFAGDSRPSLVMLISEDEYKTADTLPAFASQSLAADFRVSFLFGGGKEGNEFPGISSIKDADLMLVSVRRRLLPSADLQVLRDYVAAGKPVVGIRTASHAWSPRAGAAVPEGLAAWPEWDAEVLGGNYQNHFGKEATPKIKFASGSVGSPVLAQLSAAGFDATGSLYKNAPLRPGAQAVLTGALPDGKEEPVAWTFQNKFGGRAFYTSLGHPDEFKSPYFTALLSNGIRWAAARPQQK